jgi:hypothetical protein
MAGTSAPSSRSESRGYRPNEVLVAAIDARRVAAKLSTMNLGNVEMSDQPDLLGIVRVSWEAPRDAGDVVDEVRRDASGHLQDRKSVV